MRGVRARAYYSRGASETDRASDTPVATPCSHGSGAPSRSVLAFRLSTLRAHARVSRSVCEGAAKAALTTFS
jgi:hypothetical protein